MPFDQIPHLGGILISQRFHGFVSEAEILDSYRSRYASGTLAQRVGVIADFAEAEDLAFSAEAAQDLSLLADRVVGKVPDLVVAGVHPIHLDYGLKRLLAVHEQRTDWRLGIFRSRPEVEAWLAELGIMVEFSAAGSVSTCTLREDWAQLTMRRLP